MHVHRLRSILTAALLSPFALQAQSLPVPPPDHVVLVILENHAYSEIIGSSSAPYLNNLANGGANMAQSFAVTHPSEPNYLALFSGSTQGLASDACPLSYSTDNLAAQLAAAGKSFFGYSESLPSVGYTGCTSGAYARKHAPWVNFTNVPSTANQPFTAFPTDFTQLPTLAIVVPNLNNDMHDGTIQQGDTWVKNNLDAYVQWAKTHNSLLIVTFDEDDSSASNQVPTIFYGPMVKPGLYTEHINHYSVLRTLEDFYGLPYAGNAATATTITDIWQAAGTFSATITTPSSNVTVASGTAVAFAGSASGGTSPYTYGWTFGDGGTATGASASHTYTNTGSSNATYTVTFTANDSASHSGSATRTVTVTPAGGLTMNETESNNTTGNANVVANSGTTVTGYISSSSDTDYFKVTVPAGHTFAATLTPPSTSDFDLYLYNASGTQVASSIKGTGAVDTANVTNSGSSPATYYARVKYYAGASTTKPYTLKLTF